MLDSPAGRPEGRDLHQDAVADAWARIEKIRRPDPVRALRGGVRAPQANFVDEADVILKRIDIADGIGADAPKIRISLELHLLPIYQAPETHLAVW
ncbi:MAG: hypothetical protein JO358_02105 [Alphaproteobacteria bacterium]|nr:hypothetical protein [Alphaproteobacteria bacterium]